MTAAVLLEVHLKSYPGVSLDTSSCSTLATAMSGGLGLVGTLKRKIIESKAEVDKWKKTVEEASWKSKVGKCSFR